MDHAADDTRATLVLGGDIGGTSTRIVVGDLAGRVVSRGVGPGGNPVAHPETARHAFVTALTEALAGADAGEVRAGVIGMAGSGAVSDPAVRAGYEQVWREAGLPGSPDVRSDVEVAFAAGTEEPTGTVLIAGTGAVAGRVTGRRLSAAVGGHGWLLGDEGSGFWIGREAVRAALRVLEGAARPGVLTDLVLDELTGSPAGQGVRAELVAAAYAGPPVALSRLAPLVVRAQELGDPAATAVLDTAAAHLLATWDVLGADRDGLPVVLAGSVVQPGSHVGEVVRTELARREVVACWAAEPALGAVRLAAHALKDVD